MIAKASWFQRRKYGGWGVAPRNRQGWLYIAAVMVPFVIFQALPYWSESTRIYVTLGWFAFLLIDLLPVMVKIKRDEREFKNEAISERNAAWFMVFVLVIGLVYEIVSSSLAGSLSVDPFLATALIGGALVKTFTNIYLDRKGV